LRSGFCWLLSSGPPWDTSAAALINRRGCGRCLWWPWGSALFTIISAFGFESADQSRVAAQIVTGVGFLGAGTILRSGVTVSGLTTAATIWATAAIGMAVGSGMYIASATGTALILIILYVFAPSRDRES